MLPGLDKREAPSVFGGHQIQKLLCNDNRVALFFFGGAGCMVSVEA